MVKEKRVCVVGDIHGQFEQLLSLLRQGGLLDDEWQWAGGDASLWFLGDFVDRGPGGLPVLELVMRLQQESAAAGGSVQSLIGNHDVLLLAAHRFAARRDKWSAFFKAQWEHNGGHPPDLNGLTSDHVAWLVQLPALALHEDVLLLHADSMLYPQYGPSIEQVNGAWRNILTGDDPHDWDLLITRFCEHHAFCEHRGGIAAAQRFLDLYGGARLVHGHTPIHRMLGMRPQHVVKPHVYANRRCMNLDGGMYAGGTGFIFELSAEGRSMRKSAISATAS